MKMIVGLGNPEKKYEETRHNVGFKLVDKLCERFEKNLNEHKFHSLFTGVSLGEEKIILVKPLTYMNNSGLAVREISNYFKIDIGDIYVVYDDISIDLGSLRIRKKGSAGGHNGIKSIISYLSSMDFPRIKIGVGEKHIHMDLADYVLSNFKKSEREIIEQSIEKAAEATLSILDKGIDFAMNNFNS